MQGLKIYTKSGEAPTSEEIEFAHRVANTHKDLSFGVITMTDQTSGVVVDYHAYNKTAFTSGDVGAYFGYDSSVDMRCWCRGVVLAETSAPNQRSAVFLTDGTELGSVPRDTSMESSTGQTLNFTDIAYRVPPGSTLFRNDIFPRYFSGGDDVQYMQLFYPSNNPSIASVPITVPDDVCYTKRNAPTDYDGIFGSGWQTYKDNWNAAQTVALTREHNRRKKCSDGQLAYLRNGFLSPEIEIFVKQQHPRSTKVRRNIPMQVTVNDTTPVIEYPVGSDITSITTTTRTVMLSYTHTVDGQPKVEAETFTGTMVNEAHRAVDTNSAYTSTWARVTYDNYPMMVTTSTGASGQVYTNTTDGKLSAYDLAPTQPLMFVQNGVSIGSSLWNPDSRYGTTGYPAQYVWATEYPPSDFSGLSRAHPQFLLDYIAASKPIEKEVIDGNKVPVTPSTDWLSSRLAHNEVVTIIPLSFVNADGEDRGMYPYSRTDEVPAQVKLSGFAKVKYNYFTGSFTFESWTEFTAEGNIKHDGNASYDAETNPTSVNIGGTVYTLQPKYFAYNSAWTTPNCVCVAGKTPWTDTKAAYKTQKTNIADIPPDGYILTNEELLYNEARKAIK